MSLTDEHRAAISRGQLERHRKRREAEAELPPVETKRCSKCKKMKRVPEDFSMRTRKLKSGDTVKYPAGECLKCARGRQRAWEQRYIEEHGIEAFREHRRSCRSKKYLAEKKIRDRETSRMRRLEAGVNPRGPWKKYRVEAGGRGASLPAEPFLGWWEELPDVRKSSVKRDPSLERAMNRVVSGEGGPTESLVDRVGLELSMPHLLQSLYPS